MAIANAARHAHRRRRDPEPRLGTATPRPTADLSHPRKAAPDNAALVRLTRQMSLHRFSWYLWAAGIAPGDTIGRDIAVIKKFMLMNIAVPPEAFTDATVVR